MFFLKPYSSIISSEVRRKYEFMWWYFVDKFVTTFERVFFKPHLG